MTQALVLFGTPGQINALTIGSGQYRLQLDAAVLAQLAAIAPAAAPTAVKSGTFSETRSHVLSVHGGAGSMLGHDVTVQVLQAGASQDGYLSRSDWNLFYGKLSDAPVDAATYSRSGGSWVDISSRLFTDAPSDGSTYGRKNGAWAAVTAGGGVDILQQQVFS